MQLVLFVSVIVALVLAIAKFKLSPFLSLLFFGLLYGTLSGIDPTQAVGLVLEGFGKTLKWIAVVMIFGTIIGEILNETGGSERIASSKLKTFGEKRLPAAMGFTGYIISIPVYVAYIMMQPATEALTIKSKRNILIKTFTIQSLFMGLGGLSATLLLKLFRIL
jgi:GntP family gluconate:H+ symporter